MGMAASQARLLSITTRLSDNELRSQLINNAKMRLATESSSVSEAYIAALNDTTYMFTNYDSDNNATYSTLTFNSLTAYNEFNTQYGLSNAAGQILVSETDGANFEKSSDLTSFLACYGLEYKTTYFETLAETYADADNNIDGYDVTPNVYDDDYVKYQSLFTVKELEDFYSNSYNTVLMSSSFNNYLSLEETYIDAKEAYYSACDNWVDDVIDAQTFTFTDTDNSITYSITTNTDSSVLSIADYISNAADSDSTTYYDSDYSNAYNYATALKNISDTLKSTYTNLDTTTLDNYYSQIASLNSESKSMTDTDTLWCTSENGITYIYIDEDLRINMETGEIESLDSSGEWTSDTEDWAADDYTDDAGNSLYSYAALTNTLSCYGVTETESTDDDGTTTTTTSIDNTTVDKFVINNYDTSAGTVTATYTPSNTNEAIFELLCLMYDTFISEIVPDISKSDTFVSDIAAAYKENEDGELEQTERGQKYSISLSLYNAYKNYVEASEAMIEYIFVLDTENGQRASDVGLTFAQYEYLDDYRALLLSMAYSDSDTSDDLNCQYEDTGLKYSVDTSSYDDSTYAALLAALKAIDEDGNSTLKINRYAVSANYLDVIKAYEMETIISIYGEPSYAYIKNGDEDSNGDAEAEWYTNLYERMCEGYMVLEDGLASSAEWIQYALESGLVKLEQVDSDGEWNAITYTSCSDITETTDDTAVTLAEAEYTKAMNKIEAKDKIYDLELKNIDTEHEALQTEYDSIKNAMDKNIQRNFKLYS